MKINWQMLKWKLVPSNWRYAYWYLNIKSKYFVLHPDEMAVVVSNKKDAENMRRFNLALIELRIDINRGIKSAVMFVDFPTAWLQQKLVPLLENSGWEITFKDNEFQRYRWTIKRIDYEARLTAAVIGFSDQMHMQAMANTARLRPFLWAENESDQKTDS